MKQKSAALLISLIVLIGVLTVLSNLLGNAVQLPKELKNLAWPLLLLVNLLLILLLVWQFWLQRAPEPFSPAQGNRNLRGRLLGRMRAIWITGVLEPSLRGRALITLGLREQEDAVIPSWGPVLQQQEKQPPRSIPEGTCITEIYDDAHGELLILGEPGAGKTTLLLELARELLERAEKHDTLSLPLVFNLSGWAVKRQPLQEWLVEELDGKYQVRPIHGKPWVESDQVMPLLDGLDEVAPAHREACVAAINDYHREHSLVPLVVGSRRADYLDLTARLHLQRAVVIQPLTGRQVDDYLASAGQQLEAVRGVLDKDQELRDLTTTPFMLSILVEAYGGMSAEDLATGLLEGRQHLFASYVERVLERGQGQTSYASQQTKRWLSWLAGQLARRSQSEFSIWGVRADWLPGGWSRWVYHVVTGLLYGLPLGLLVGLRFGATPGLACGLLVGFIGMLLGGLATGEGRHFDSVVEIPLYFVWSRQDLQDDEIAGGGFAAIVATTLVGGLVGGLLAALTTGLPLGPVYGIVGILVSAAFAWVVLRMGGGLVFEVLNARLDVGNRLMPRQRMRLLAGLGVLLGLMYGLIYGAFVGLPVALSADTSSWFEQLGLREAGFLSFVVLLFLDPVPRYVQK